jgi:hypothetical protein
MDEKKSYKVCVDLLVATKLLLEVLKGKWRGSGKRYFDPCRVLSSFTPLPSLGSLASLFSFLFEKALNFS